MQFWFGKFHSFLGLPYLSCILSCFVNIIYITLNIVILIADLEVSHISQALYNCADYYCHYFNH